MNGDPDPDYLWDGRGPVDPDVAKLERALGGLKHQGTLDVSRLEARPPPRKRRPWIATGGALLAAAAAVALWVLTQTDTDSVPSKPLACSEDGGGFRFSVTTGAPTCDGAVVASGRLPVGGAIETGASDEVRVEIANIGHIQLAGDSRLALVRTSAQEHRLALDRGKLHARVIAPPRLFVIDTPAATAVDLGCEYDLEIGADGASLLRVTSGKVELVGQGRTVLVPMGAETVSRKGEPPGTPWSLQASPALRAAIAQVDAGGQGAKEALATVLELAAAHDTMTLWNLLSIVGAEPRGLIFDRITGFVPQDWVLRQDVVRGDAEMIAELGWTLQDVWFRSEVLAEPKSVPVPVPGSGTGLGSAERDASAPGMTWE